MAYTITENRIGLPPIGSVSLSGAITNSQVGQSVLNGKAIPLGTIVRADDPTQGGGEFIYLEGVASTLVGSLVSWDPIKATTALSPNALKPRFPFAVATAATTAKCYGWYQIAGAAKISKVTGVVIKPGVPIYLTSTTGSITGATASGKVVEGAITVGATANSAATTVNVLINRPHGQAVQGIVGGD
jgi:hypothetical protein